MDLTSAYRIHDWLKSTQLQPLDIRLKLLEAAVRDRQQAAQSV